jgi:hypothetical protein
LQARRSEMFRLALMCFTRHQTSSLTFPGTLLFLP